MPDREVDRWNDEKKRTLDLIAEAESAELSSEEARLHRAAVLETARRELRESSGRVAAILAAAEGGRNDA